MLTHSKIVNDAIDEFSKISGIGSKTALRIVLEFLNWSKVELFQFSDAIKALNNSNIYCNKCFNFTDETYCKICLSDTRNKDLICIVADVRSLITIENTHSFNGQYHVLGGLISPINGIGPDDLRIDELINKLNQDKVKEVFIVLSATMDGDTTMYYLYKKIAPLGLKITTISRGIALGEEIEFTDNSTLSKSIENRILCNKLYEKSKT